LLLCKYKKPLKIEAIIDQQVLNLSGGELQRVAIAICLGTPADIYLIDEPSAYLDSEQVCVFVYSSVAQNVLTWQIKLFKACDYRKASQAVYCQC